MSASKRKRVLLKIILVGDSGVGKTSFLNMYLNNKFSPQIKATIGADFLTKQIEVNGFETTLQIWDTAGRERFAHPGVAFFRGSDAVLLMFDLTNKKSFENVVSWKKELEKSCPTSPFVLVGTKLDLDKRTVRMEEAEALAEQWNVPYIEISSKDNIRLQEAMRMLLDQVQISIIDEEIPRLDVNVNSHSPSLWDSVSAVGSWLYSWIQPAALPSKEEEKIENQNMKSLPGN